LSVAGVCRVCKCTDARPCVLDAENNVVAISEDDHDTLPMGHTLCSWVEPDLCSGCIADRTPALMYDADGKPLRGAP
jgi:hypothetical protein